MPQFELTHYGEPICISEYACRIARNDSVHVLQINDDQPQLQVKVTMTDLMDMFRRASDKELGDETQLGQFTWKELVYEVIESDLSDRAVIGGTEWKALKEKAMQDGYREQDWFVSNSFARIMN